jgi:DNA-binding beta-propeller fold protein YncE
MRRTLVAFLLLVCPLLFLAPPAQAQRAVLSSALLNTKTAPGGVEGICGITTTPAFYVSDYYHHGIDAFSPTSFQQRIPFGPLDGPCQLAGTSAGVLYANEWHRGVSRVLPTPLSFDTNESTGVAVDPTTGNVYVNDRSYVAAYEPSGAPLLFEGLALKIGEGTLTEAYGLAYAAGRLYVGDAGTGTVEVYEPTLSTTTPVLTIEAKATPQKGFNSLIDTSVAVDPTNGHVLVTDNLQPGAEHPEAAIDEFDSSGAFLGQLPKRVIDGGPSGMAFEGGTLYVTSGNSEESNVVEFGPYSGGTLGAGTGSQEGPALAQLAGVTPRSAAAQGSQAAPTATPSKKQGSEAVVIQRGGIKVSFDGRLAPKKLPRDHPAPVRVSVAAQISSATEGKDPPQLRTISIAINRFGRFDTAGLPLCTERDIQPATTQNALRACKDAQVGVGTFSASVGLSRQSPFPAEGKMFAFNARINGKPAILAHVYGTKPVPTSFTFPFLISASKGAFGTTLTAKLPNTGKEGFITGLSMNLGRNYRAKGKAHAYLSASCPAPKGFSVASFPLAKAGFGFEGGRQMGSTLVRSCGVGG